MFNPLNLIVHFWLHHTVHCAEKIVCACYTRRFCVSRKGGAGGGGWGHPQGDIAWTGLVNATLALYRGSFLAGKAAWALRDCMTTKSADYCMLVNEQAWSRL